MTITFGVFDHMDRAEVPIGVQYEERLKLIEAYDQGGFHAYHLSEHHATPLGMAPSPSVFLAAVAQRTKRLRFGALVNTLTLHHPLRLAEEICMLDQMSGGRLELGIGRGMSPRELAYYGVAVEEAQSIYLEASEIIFAALAGETLTYKGKHFTFEDVPLWMKPVQKPRPPLWCGTGNPDGMRWFAENRVNVVTHLPAAKARLVTDRYRAEWAGLGGAPDAIPFLGLARHVVIADTEAEAMRIGRIGFETWLESFMLLWRKPGLQIPSGALPESFEEFARAGLAFVGTPAMVLERMLEHAETAGVNYILCRFAFGAMPYEASRRSVDLFVSEVMPKMRAWQAA